MAEKREKAAKGRAPRKPTQKVLLDQMRISRSGPYYRNPSAESYWEYLFVVEFFGIDFRFPIIVQDAVAEADRDRTATQIFKETVALIAKKVKAF
jgi:hypothetical protein